MHSELRGGPAVPSGSTTDPVDEAVNIIRQHKVNAAPRLGLILGSGLGGFVDSVEDAVSIAYEDLPGFHGQASRA